MQTITLNEIAGASYRTHAFKVYEARNQVSRYTTIKAAVRVARRAL